MGVSRSGRDDETSPGLSARVGRAGQALAPTHPQQHAPSAQATANGGPAVTQRSTPASFNETTSPDPYNSDSICLDEDTQNILMVGTDTVFAQLVAEAKETLDIKVESVADLDEALEACQQQSFAVVVLCWSELKSDVLEFCGHVRECPLEKQPVVVAAGVPTTSPLADVLRAGVDDIVLAPMTRSTLCLRITICQRQARLRLHHYKAQEKLRQRESMLGALFKDSRDAIYITSVDGTILEMNPAGLRLLGYSRNEMIGRNSAEFYIDPEDRHRFSRAIGEEGSLHDFLVRLKSRDGRLMDCLLTSTIQRDRDGTVIGYQGVIRDMTDHLKAERQLRDSEERYALAARGSNDGLWDWDLRRNRVYYSPRWKSMLGYADDEIGTRPDAWFDLVHQDDIDPLRAQLSAHLQEATPHLECEYRMRHRDGTYRWVLCRGQAVWDGSGQAYRMAGSLTDITEHKRTEEQLLFDALHDSLTGLPNRAVFIDRVGQALQQQVRRPDRLFSVLFLDLDRFQNVNKSLGHLLGDQLLVTVSRRLRTLLKPGDMVARIGGDEFCMLLDDLNDIGDVTRMAEQVLQELTQPFKLGDQEVYPTTSVGIALSATGYQKPEDLLRDAHTAMYRAKAQGRGQYELFDKEMHARAVSRLILESDLRKAVDRDQFRLVYQPIVTLDTGEISSFEALVRWDHPDKGEILPSHFIPVAEETGLIDPLGEFVLREACAQIKAWQDKFPEHKNLSVNVNVSGGLFARPQLIDQVTSALNDTGLSNPSLHLEITESVMMENQDAVTEMLVKLRSLEIEVHVDDFGTGYSSLSYLQQFPVNTLKIDRSFVMGMNKGNMAIIRAILTLAESLGINVTAEGIEHVDQRNLLHDLRCRFGQGLYFAGPLQADQVEHLLAIPPQW